MKYQIRDGGVFTIDSVTGVEIKDDTHFSYPPGAANATHYYQFTIRAKIQPASAAATVLHAEAKLIYNGTQTKTMYREDPGDPTNYFYRTKVDEKFGVSGPTAAIGPLTASVTATIQSTEGPQELVFNLPLT